MDGYLQNEMPGLNGLLEKHKQMQERSAIKSQAQVLQNAANILSPANPMLQPGNGLYPGNPVMVPYANNYLVGSPMLQCPTSYYSPNPMLQPVNGYFNTNPMLQPPNNYFNPNPMLQNAAAAAAAANYFHPNPMMQSPNNYFNPNPMPQFPMPAPMPQNNYFNQNLIPQYDNNYFNPTPASQYQNATYLQNPVPHSVNSNYALVSQYLNGTFNPNPMSQCTNNSYSQNLAPLSINSNFNGIPVSQNISSNFTQNFVDNFNASSYRHQNHLIQQKHTPLSTGKVYVNPNYKKPLVHVDTKSITNIACKQETTLNNVSQSSQPATSQANVQGKHLVHVNPKLMTKLISNVKESEVPCSSIALITTIASNESSPSCQIMTNTSNLNSNSNVDKNTLEVSSLENLKEKDDGNKLETTEIDDASKKSSNSSILILTRRKLVRIKKSPKSNTNCTNFMKPIVVPRRRLLSTGSKKLKISPKKISSSSNQLYNTSKLKYVNSMSKKVLSHSVGIVNIDGVLYSKSRNQLVRSNSSVVKRKRDSISDTSVEYYVAEDGKKLLKLDIVKQKSVISQAKLNTILSPVKNYKSNASYKVKRKSLQILRDKMRKNNQPCLLFQKFGFCANQLKGICPKVHDKKLVAVCRKFLQGKCLSNNCPLSHDVGPEKMPTCKYFLEGHCTRERCPYLHVKVSSKKPICTEFLRGYCPRGNECPNRHIIACPEFDRSGSCSKGKFCPYPHKSPLTDTKRSSKGVATSAASRRKSDASARSLKRINKSQLERRASSPVAEIKKRYYDEETSEDLSQKRQRLLGQLDIAKSVHAATASNSSEPSTPLPSSPGPTRNEEKAGDLAKQSSANQDGSNQEPELVCSRPKRPPIGPLPAYIPIE